MSQHTIRRAAMALTGVAVTATGLLAMPSTGGAVAAERNLPVETTVTVPPEIQKVVDDVGDVVAPTTTTTGPEETSTTTAPSTSTTTSTTTTTTTTVPVRTGHETVDDTVAEAVEVLDDVVEPPVGMPSVDELRDDYRRIDHDYTPVFGKRSTADVIGILASIGAPFETRAQVLAPFPVAGSAHYSDDWGAVRTNPSFHLHEGTDVFAERGTPVIATTTGEISRISLGTAVGGNSVHLTTADGTYYYYAHLDTVSPLLHQGMQVAPGAVLGTVGTSGNAEGTSPHLHFEIHPGGGHPVPPAPYLDAWLRAAEEKAHALVEGAATPAPVPLPTPAPHGPAQQAELAAFDGEASSIVSDLPGLAVLFAPGAIFLATRRRKAAEVIASLEARVRRQKERDVGRPRT